MPKPDPNQLLEDLKAARTEANRSKSAIVQYEKTAQSKTSSIDKLLITGKRKLDGVVVDLKARFTKETNSIKSSAKTETDAIGAIRKEAKDNYNRFNRTYTAAANKRTGVEAKHQRVLKFADEAATNANEISKNATKAANTTGKITELLTSARGKGKEITTIHEQAEAVNQEIQNTYAITLDTTMAGTFKERRDALKTRTDYWEMAYLASIGCIILAIILILTVGKPQTFESVLTDRFVFITPLVLVSFVISRQFNHERKLYEEYAFKTAAAQALRGYTVLLNEQFGEDTRAQKQILQFTITTMSNIFDNDTLTQKPTTYHFAFGHGLTKFEAKLEQVVQKVARETAQEVVNDTEVV